LTDQLQQLIEKASQRGPKAVRPAARLMSVLEDEPTRLPALLRAAAQVLGVSDPAELPQPQALVGITGAPGSGKSTLTDAMITNYRKRHPDRRVGVIAVDPSSPFTGGAVLGDRVRMMKHASDPMVFVRSMASRGHLGGLSLGVKGVVRAMGLLGCDLVIIETVGVGQSEVEIAQVADTVLVVLAPGQGDSVQLLKAGLMEIGDWFVVNKADREGARQLYSQLLSALHMNLVESPGHHGPGQVAAPGQTHPAGADVSGNGLSLSQYACQGEGAVHDANEEAVTDLSLQASAEARVYLVAASDGTGMDTLMDGMEQRIERDQAHWRTNRRQAVRDELGEAILEAARYQLLEAMHSGHWLSEQLEAVMDDGRTIDRLAQRLLERTVARDSPQASKMASADQSDQTNATSKPQERMDSP
jgi:LAO/AO transport system ATPase